MVPSKMNYCPYCGKCFEKHNINFCTYCGKNLRRFNSSPIKRVSCTICHEPLSSWEKEKIRCTYCESQFHRKCITSWLLEYNSCPMCLNVFLHPNPILRRRELNLFL